MNIVARAVRDGDWWCVEVPLNGNTYGTQGRTLAEAQLMAEDVVSIFAEELDDDALSEASVTLEIAGAEQEAVQAVRDAQAQLEQARRNVKHAQIQAVASMRARGVTMQDIAQVLGVTKGRVSQLAHS